MTTTTAPAHPSAAGERRARHLGRRARRAVLTLHILAAGAWIGIDVVLGVLVITARTTGDPATEALCYRALDLFAVGPLFGAGLVTLLSGAVLGLGTSYGLLRYKWVATKLVLNLVLVTLVAVALRPGVSDAARYADALAAGQPTDTSLDGLVFPPIVSGLALSAATILSVFKPWGRIRRRASSA
jgi:hypothetical protein